MQQLLTVDEVARRLNTSAAFVYKLVSSGDLEAVRLTAGAVRVSEKALTAFIERRTK